MAETRRRWRKNLRNVPMGVLLIVASPIIAIAALFMWIVAAVDAVFGKPEEP